MYTEIVRFAGYRSVWNELHHVLSCPCTCRQIAQPVWEAMFFMNTLHLNYAIEVARTRSITLAAENMFMSQPNLSKAIKELEENLGFPIFERSTRGMSPTGKGSEFLIYARNILDQLEKVDMLSNPENDRIQHFNVSIPRSSYIADGFTKFAAELDTEKGVDLNIQETNSMSEANRQP